MESKRTHYDILGLDSNASFEDVRQKYRELATKLHPDKDYSHNEEFKKINEAYSILKDYHKRREYDKQLETSQRVMTPFIGTRNSFSLFDDFDLFFTKRHDHMRKMMDEITEANIDNNRMYSYSSSLVNNNGVETQKIRRQTYIDGKKNVENEYIKKQDGKIIDHQKYGDDLYKKIKY